MTRVIITTFILLSKIKLNKFMPIYIFQNDKTGEIKEVVQKMKDSHKIKGWTRIFVNPQMSVDAILDPFDAQAWNRRTSGKKGVTIGEMMEYSGELSDKRAKIAGSDPFKDKVIDDYERRTHRKHSSKIPKSLEIDLCKKQVIPKF